MTTNNTLGYIKKRILDTLGEYSGTNAVFVSDGNREVVVSRIPDAVNSALVRMSESLPIGTLQALVRINRHETAECVLKNGNVCFTVNGDGAAIVAGYFGSGELYVENSQGERVFETECNESAERIYKRAVFAVESGEEYTLKHSVSLDIEDVAVYEADALDDENKYAPKGYYTAKLPEDFDRFISVRNGSRELNTFAEVVGGFAIFEKDDCESADTLNVVYKKKTPVILEETDDSFILQFSPLAIEALICLAAAELCREDENALYSRLYSKYLDLSEGLHKSYPANRRHNIFYMTNHGRR